MRVDFAYAKRWIRREFPSRYPVSIRCVKRSSVRKDQGTDAMAGHAFYHQPHRHTVLVDGALNLDARIEALFHEWPHVLLSECELLLKGHFLTSVLLPPEQGDDPLHPNLYWLLHGKIYRAWHKD